MSAKKVAGICLLALAVLTAAAGCSKSNETPDGGTSAQGAKDTGNTKPVTLNFYSMPAFNEDQIKRIIIEPMQAKYPNITIQIMNPSAKKQDAIFDSFVAGGTIPDVMLTNYETLRVIKDKAIASDLTPLIKSHNFNTGSLDASAISFLKNQTSNGSLIALPYFLNIQTLMYNKELFDKFGVAYPKDGMTWDDVTELARKMTRQEQGVQYLGINPGRPHQVAAELGLEYVNEQGTKAAVNNEGWKKVFDLMKNIYSIPGNLPANKEDMWGVKNPFYQSKTLAMGLMWWNGIVGDLRSLYEQGDQLNWDIVTAPTFKEKPNVGTNMDQFVLSVSKQTKVPDDAFRMVAFLLGKEDQLKLSENGYVPSLNDQEAKQNIGKGLDFLQGKNTAALFKLQTTKPMNPVNFDVQKLMNQQYEDVLYNGKDTNSALRDWEESINKAIEESSK